MATAKYFAYYKYLLFCVPVDSHQNQCNLPTWLLKHHQYHNLNETLHYHFNKKGNSLTIKQMKIVNVIGGGGTVTTSSKTLKCNTILEESKNYSRMIMQVKFEW